MKKLKLWRKADGTASENMHILSDTNERQGRKGKKKTLEQTAKKILKCLQHSSRNKKNSHPANEESPLLGEDADKNPDSLMQEGKFLEACKLIYGLDDTEEGKEILYEQVACAMWLVVKQALFGQENDWQLLRSVMAAVEWEEEKRQESLKDDEDSQYVLKWSERLEKRIKEELRNQISQVPSVDRLDVAGIQNHLKNLEEVFLQSVVISRPLQKVGLLNIYVRSFQHCVLSHITGLISATCCPKICTMLYRLGSENYKNALLSMKQSQRTERNPGQKEKSLGPTDTGMCQQNLEALDHLLYIDWKSTNEKKLIDVIQKDMNERLNNILNSETKLLSSSPGDILHDYPFGEIIQVFITTIEEVQGINTNLTEKVQAVCLKVLLQCVSSYGHFIEDFLGPGQCSGTWTYHELRVIEDCCILRDTLHRLAQLGTAPEDINTEVEKSIDKTEDQGRKSFLQTLSSKFKKTLKNHFCNDSGDFDDALKHLHQRLTYFKGYKSESYESFIKFAHHRVVVEYLQAFLTSARQLTADLPHITSKIDQDSKKIQDIFQRCLNPDVAALGNPLRSIVGVLRATDLESVKIEVFFLIANHSDLRKEHLIIMLDLKGTIKAKERKVILEYFNGRMTNEDQQMCFFEEIEVNQLNFVGRLCCCCM